MKTSFLRSLSAALLATAIASSPVRAGEAAGDTPREPPHYESPIVALLFLPVTLLLKIAEVVSPEPAARSDDRTEK